MPKLLDGSILLKFLLQTRPKSSILILWMTCCGFRFKSYDLETIKLVINPIIRKLLLSFGHNFWTRNVWKLIKVSKDSDSSLVSIESLSKIFPSSSWAQIRYYQPKTYFTYDIAHKKSKIQNQIIFFHFQTRRLSESFEGLNSSLTQLAEELWH